MISSIGSSMASSMQMTQSSKTQGSSPKDGNVFQVSDSDGDGLVSSTELETLVAGMEEVTGNTISVDDAIATYDANQDGGLSGEELFEMLSGSGFAPVEMAQGSETGEAGEAGQAGPPPPPPASFDEALSAYGENSDSDQISELLSLLQGSDSEEQYSSIDITS